MNLLLIVSALIFMPFLMAYIFYRLKIRRKWITYIFTLVFIISIDNYLNPPTPGEFRCGNPLLGLIFGIWIIGVPIGMMAQYAFNKFLNKKLENNINIT